MATINTIFKFGIRNGYVSPIFVPEFPRIQKNVNRREPLTLKELRTITNFMKSNKFLDEKDPLKTRHFVRDFTVLLGNTGLRFGE